MRRPPHLLDIETLSDDAIRSLLDDARRAFDNSLRGDRDCLRGKTIFNVFFESSTRTRASFELAGKRLGADVINVGARDSSVIKGETLLDTVRNLEAMGADAIVLRHASAGAPHFIARKLHTSVINAGDGAHEHPTQALLDALTIERHKSDLRGRVITICGDIVHSRVARSDLRLLGRLGADLRLCAPRTMIPRGIELLAPKVTIFSSFEEAVDGADVIMMLRIQHERRTGALMSTPREYARTFGLSPRMLAFAKRDVLVMHPGPINRGVELDAEVADCERSAILEQVQGGVAVRMAVFRHLLGHSVEGPPS